MKYIVNLTDPYETKSSKFGNFVSYRVNTIIIANSLHDYKKTECTVIRRYRDFFWLYEILCWEFPGSIIPPIPPKQAIGRFESDFIKIRMYGLERFIVDVAKHSALNSSSYLLTFLQSDDNQLEYAKSKVKIEKENEESIGLLNWIDYRLTNLFFKSDDINSKIQKTEEDITFDEWNSYFTTIHSHFGKAVNALSSIIKFHAETAIALSIFGESLSKIEITPKNNLITFILNQVEVSSDSCTQSSLPIFECFRINIEERFRILNLSIAEAMSTLKRREVARLKFVEVKFQTDNAQSSYNRAVGIPGKERLAATRLESLRQSEDYLQITRFKFMNISATLKNELLGLNDFLQIELREISVHFVELNVNHTESLNSIWKTVMNSIVQKTENSPLDSNVIEGHFLLNDDELESEFVGV